MRIAPPIGDKNILMGAKNRNAARRRFLGALFGMFTDRHGAQWMIGYDRKPPRNERRRGLAATRV